MTIKTWGTIGTIIIAIIVFSQYKKNKFHLKYSKNVYLRNISLVSISAIVIYILIFLRLPLESGYLLPIIPFSLILLNIYINKRMTVILTICLIISSFFLDINRNGIKLEGPVLNDRLKREENLKYIKKILIKTIDKKETNFKIISESWLPKIMVVGTNLNLDNNLLSHFIYFPTFETINKLLFDGQEVYFLKGIKEEIIKYYGSNKLLLRLKEY